jgi:transcriptional regulator with XRE-family HTH domain
VLTAEAQGEEATTVAQGSPTVRRRELGAALRALRNQKGLKVEQVAGLLLCSPSKVSRMETGHRSVTLRDVRDLCQIYEVTDPEQRDWLTGLAKQGKEHGWWQSYELPNSIATYVGLEAEAVRLQDFDSAVIPGLLQIPEYVRALHDDPAPEPTELTPDLVDQRIGARLRRQQLLIREDQPPLELHAIVDESALHRVIGGPQVMRDQLRMVIEKTRLPNVSLQVVPFSAGAHPALDSTFTILEFTRSVSDIVYSEGLAGFLFMERPEDVARYQGVFQHLCEIALTPGESAELMERLSEAYDQSIRAASLIEWLTMAAKMTSA